MLTLLLAFLAVSLTVAGFALRRDILLWIAAGFWIIMGVQSYTQSTATWDVYYATFWLSMFVGIVIALSPTIFKEKDESLEEVLEPEEQEDEDDIREYTDNMERYHQQADRLKGMTSRKIRHKRKVKKNKKELSNFAMTGVFPGQGKKKRR